jgi:hypothetical protein
VSSETLTPIRSTDNETEVSAMASHNPGNLHTPPQPQSDGRQMPGDRRPDGRAPEPYGDRERPAREPGEPARPVEDDQQDSGREQRDARARHEARRMNDAGEER